MAQREKRTAKQRWLLVVGIVGILLALASLAASAFSFFGGAAMILANEELVASANQSIAAQGADAALNDVADLSALLLRVGAYFLFSGFSLLVCGTYAAYSSNRVDRMYRLSRCSTGAIAVTFVGILWTPWRIVGMSMLPFYLFVLGIEIAVQLLARSIRRDATGEAAEALTRERDRRQMPREERLADPTRLGFLRLVQAYYAFDILFTLVSLVFVSRDNVQYDYHTLFNWANIVFEGVCFYMLWNRLRITKWWVIGFSVFDIVADTIYYIVSGASAGSSAVVTALVLVLISLWDIILVVYFLRSDRVRLVMTRDISLDVEDDALLENRHGWPFVRNMLFYYCIFSTLGHWMEAGFCYLVSLGIFQGDVDFGNTMLFRDWLYPFPMHGIAVVLVALVLWPLKQRISRHLSPILTLVVSFLVNMTFCSVIEFTGGIMFNRNLQLWNYSDMPFNFMGQVCLQNAVGFGVAATLIVYVVYPFLERALARIPNDVMNTVCVGVFTFYGILTTLYVIDTSAAAAEANAAKAILGPGTAQHMLRDGIRSAFAGRM